MTEHRGLGWLPEFPDQRDYPVARLLRAEPVPRSHSNRQRQSPVRDQDRIGSCVGFAVAAAVEYLRRTDLDLHSTIYSPLWVYWQARLMRGWQEWDTGAFIRDGVKSVQKLGIATEGDWPYGEYAWKFRVEPSPSAARDATRWKLGTYYRCDSEGDVLRAIAAGHPVVGGFTCYTNMFTQEVSRTGDVPMPRGAVEGGHAVLFVGYDQGVQRVSFKNSWGEGWGRAGYGTLPLAYLRDRNLSDDFWALSIESEESFRGRAP